MANNNRDGAEDRVEYMYMEGVCVCVCGGLEVCVWRGLEWLVGVLSVV